MSTQQLTVPPPALDDAPLLSVELVGCGPVTVIVVAGDLDMTTAHLLTELIEQVVVEHPSRVVLDMAGVSFFCADGLRALLHARTTITAAGGRLVLRAPSATTRRVLTITGTDHLFPLERSEASPRRDGASPRSD